MNVGDKVRIREGAILAYSHKVGDVGTIVSRDWDGFDVKTSNGQRGYYYPDELEPVTPAVPGYGVTPDQLAEYVKGFIEAAQSRVRGVGAEQYSNGTSQKFEDMPILDLLQYAREEAQDLAVYAAMLDIRFARMAEKLTAGGAA